MGLTSGREAWRHHKRRATFLADSVTYAINEHSAYKTPGQTKGKMIFIVHVYTSIHATEDTGVHSKVAMYELLLHFKKGLLTSSVDVKAFGGTKDREILPTGLKYFAQREVGGNPIVIGFAHG